MSVDYRVKFSTFIVDTIIDEFVSLNDDSVSVDYPTTDENCHWVVRYGALLSAQRGTDITICAVIQKGCDIKATGVVTYSELI